MWLTGLLLVVAEIGAYQLQKQVHSSAMIFGPLAKVQFSYSDWSLVYYYELEEYFNESKLMEENTH